MRENAFLQSSETILDFGFWILDFGLILDWILDWIDLVVEPRGGFGWITKLRPNGINA